MANKNIIKLTRINNGGEFYLNTNFVKSFYREGNKTTVTVDGSGDLFFVETPDDIMTMMYPGDVNIVELTKQIADAKEQVVINRQEIEKLKPKEQAEVITKIKE